MNSSRRITERLGSSLPKSSDIYLATHRRQTRALAFVGDADASAYELLFSFASSEGKEQLLHLVRTNEDVGNDYIEDDCRSPPAEEIRNARPIGTVLPPDVVNRIALIAATLCVCRVDSRSAS